MRRSAAPSQQLAAKRNRFTVPYKPGHSSSQQMISGQGGDTDRVNSQNKPVELLSDKLSASQNIDGKDVTFTNMTSCSASSDDTGEGRCSLVASHGMALSIVSNIQHMPDQKSPLMPYSYKVSSKQGNKKELMETNASSSEIVRNNRKMVERPETRKGVSETFTVKTVPSNETTKTEGMGPRSPLKPINISRKFKSSGVCRPQTVGAKSMTSAVSLGVNSGSAVRMPEVPDQDGGFKTTYFAVVWCKLSKKKHKKWEGDAILLTKGRSVTLYDMEGKEIGKGAGYKSSELESLKEDETLVIGGKEIQVMSQLTEEQFKTGKCFSGAGSVKDDKPAPCTQTQGASKAFCNPLLGNKAESGQMTRMSEGIRHQAVVARFDPLVPGALVMPRPSPVDQWQHNKNHVQIVDVVVDPHLSIHLRPHQREGVVFLYECIMGMRNYGGTGAILADDMGLGKTLQCISLIWTLLKQGPFGGKPPVKRVLIITPGSLVKNWSQEFKKWLGSERLQVFVISGDKRVEEYVKTAVYPVLIISYEMFVRGYDVVKHVPFDLVVCDEGHRLKNTAIKTTSLIMSLSTRRRIILSGTPIQNDLQEFFSVVDFCNPGVLGSSVAFRRVYEEPILASRQPEASKQEVELGEQRASELARLTRMFVMRRTQEINNAYLPPKVELVLFCRASPRQTRIYHEILRSSIIRSCLLGRGCGVGQGAGTPHLLAIAALKQLCNHPALLAHKVHSAASRDAEDTTESGDSLFSGLVSLYQDQGAAGVTAEDSGKLATLASILKNIFDSSPNEKVVLVSNHTKTLDLLQQFCKEGDYSCVRLDGQTPTSQRQEIVARFNSAFGQEKIFLLSSKAGGVGLNLVGASRLFLFDIDWNPANDLQAMARVWRDGQKKQVYIYRLITAGTIEEKVYQRQISKQGLSGAVIDFKTSDIQFSREDLRDLFSFNEDTECETHTLLGCQCSCDGKTEGDKVATTSTQPVLSCQQGPVPATLSAQAKNVSMAELLDWHHLSGSSSPIKQEWQLSNTQDVLSFLFWHETLAAKLTCQ